MNLLIQHKLINWDNLDDLTDEELYQLHLVCLRSA